MNKDKQIEETVKDFDTVMQSRCFHKSCNECEFDRYDTCKATMLADALVNDYGYRKAPEVAREIFEEIEKTIADLEYRANTPRKTVKVEELKAQCDWILHEVLPKTLAELKKKYTEEGK